MHGPIRKIVDSNALQSTLLRTYFSESITNFAVVTDYAAMEAHKGDTLASIFPSMALLAEFPKQVMVLKTTGVVCGLSGRQAGLRSRMIDQKQTRGFPEYCKALDAARLGNESARQQLLDNGRAADEQMNRMLADAQNMPDAVRATSARFTEYEVKLIRTDSQFSDQLIRKVLDSVIALTRELYVRHPKPPAAVRTLDELSNTFLFRTALCGFFLALDWIAVGGPKDVKITKLRNDIVDVNFAAYATFFDGLLSMDEKLVRIYHRAAFVLDAITNGADG